MTKDEVIEMAKQTGLWFVTNREDLLIDFAKLVDAKATARERARIYAEQLGDSTMEAIRARGEANG